LSNPILTTKLFSPSLPARRVARPLLVSQLEEGVRLGRRLSLVSAPAGFGKTCLVTEWLAATDHAYAWVSLDEGDNDPVRFFRYLLAALQKVYPGVGESAASLLGGPQQPALESLIAVLVNDLAAAGQPVVLVLDDYHLIRNTNTHQAMQLLIERIPSGMHIVLVTREDPPLGLARLRVRGQMTEIRVADLRFTLEESGQFLETSLGASLPAGSVASLEERTEGWIAGLQLASLSLQGRQDVDEFITAFNGSHHYIIDYLADEVLRRQPPEIREFLGQTAILERMCAEPCDAVIYKGGATPVNDPDGSSSPFSNSASMLSYLEKSNLFLIPLDETRTWFRYHHLFADTLRTESRGNPIKERHARAAHWYELHGYPADAIHHFRAAEDLTSAMRVVEEAASDLVRLGELSTLLAWIDLLPEEWVRSNPVLATYKGMILLIGEHVTEAHSFAASAQDSISDEAPAILRGRLAGLQAFLATAQGDNARTLDLCQQAADLLGEEDDTLLGFILAKLGQSQQQAGDIPAALATFRRALEVVRRIGRGMATAVVYSNLALITQILGRRREAEAICRQGLAECQDSRGRAVPVAILIDVALGVIQYQSNQLDQAESRLNQVMETSRQLGFSTIMVGGRNTLSLIQYARGDHPGAYTSLEETISQAEQAGAQGIARTAASVRADLKLRDGKLDPAAEWLESSHLPFDTIDLQRQTEYFTACRVMARQKRFAEAQQLVDELRRVDVLHGCNAYLIVDWILQADLYAALGDSVRAVQSLERAVRLAAEEDLRRPFLDYGTAVLPLVEQVRGAAPRFVDALVERDPGQEITNSPIEPARVSASEVLEEPLSERELDVLRLLALGLSSRDIAGRLVLSEGTARWHVNNILAKLGVHSRSQAVAAARQLGLIP
jgi:LuxR family transcriptional regulator, maltose regulon positive regulatory protein